MMNLYVVSTDQHLGEQVADALRDAGADDVVVLGHSEEARAGVNRGSAGHGRVAGVRRSSSAKKNDRYIFIVQSPQEKLLEALPGETSDQAFAQDLTAWFDEQAELLSDYEAQRGQAILVTQTQVKLGFDDVLHRINQTWRARLSGGTAGISQSAEAGDDKPLVGYLAQGLIQHTPKLKQLTARIERLAGNTLAGVSVVDAMQAYRQKNQQQVLKTELESLQQRNYDLEAQLKDATEEGELILLQLHQVQEELENYFLKYKDAENRHETLAYRWRQMLALHPDYVVYESVSVEVLDDTDEQDELNEPNEPQILQWYFKGLESAGVSRQQLAFQTFIEAGMLGVRFNKTASLTAGDTNASESFNTQSLTDDEVSVPTGLTHWPDVAEELDQIDCIPAGRGEIKVLRATVLRDLSASDWALLKLIPKLVTQALEERPREGVDAEAIVAAAKRLAEALDRLPQALRHDGVRLKNHQTNPDYEHLWLVFENLTDGVSTWPAFELRLGASNVISNNTAKSGTKTNAKSDATANFTQHPKVEIPLIDGQTKPFEGWFEESVDDFGAKWELRFDLKKQIFDAGVWNELAPAEQVLVKGLVGQLSHGLLKTVESDLKRGNIGQWERVFGQCVAMLG
ncbi:hypothetical protein [Orrella daihaiensis]|uniref:Uncharacterized protein n=1 Tax=Orrella daihaiensis TaxID=2782176 RepID=A0ABY4AN83_9BURK|nr:hypothetical protein [Orrella daihaiensis]UOD51423.1 hypothetical protein DHf2319_06250 [Orrella daihaiensis]